MGRRSVPKSNQSVDLTGYLYDAEELPTPWDPSAIFGRSAPLEIEVGTGKGLFLINAATALPSHNFLGIEIARAYAALTGSRMALKSLNNAAMLHGDARPLFADLLPDDHVEAVHVYFPDPWWKKRHRRRRVMTEEFLIQIERVLIPGGRLHFWTDVAAYFEATLQLIEDKTSLEGPFEVPTQPPVHDMDYHTHFERRVRLNGLPVYRSEFAKPAWKVEFQVGLDAVSPPRK